GGQPGDVLATEDDPPRSGTYHSRQAIEESALAGTVGADDGADLAAPGREIHIAERRQAAEANGERLGTQDHVASAVGARGRGGWRGRIGFHVENCGRRMMLVAVPRPPGPGAFVAWAAARIRRTCRPAAPGSSPWRSRRG